MPFQNKTNSFLKDPRMRRSFSKALRKKGRQTPGIDHNRARQSFNAMQGRTQGGTNIGQLQKAKPMIERLSRHLQKSNRNRAQEQGSNKPAQPEFNEGLARVLRGRSNRDD
jgi:hypothetical protein